MPDSNIQDGGNVGGDCGRGLSNLFALAQLAVMSEEERGVASSSSLRCNPPTASTEKKAASPSSSNRTRSPAPRRPAKKRAVPAEFDAMTVTTQCYGAIAAATASPESHNKPSTTTPTPAGSSNKPTKLLKQTKSKQRGSTTFKMKANQPSFPVILMAIMSAPQNKEFITFLSDGKSFIIVHPGALAKIVLPIHFEENVPTFDQFLNLLAIWGFEVIKDPQFPRVNVYKHPLFRRGEWESCLQMKLPDPNDQQVVNEVMKISVARSKSSQGGNNNHRLPEPRRDVVSMANNLPSPPPKTRSVTPPENPMREMKSHIPHLSSGAALLERLPTTQTMATQTTQWQRQEYSNLGPKFSSMEENLMYQRLLQESGMRSHSNMQDQVSASFQQPRLQRDISQVQMMGYSDPFMMNTTLPLNHRRASLGVMTSMPSSPSLMGNNAMPRKMGRMSPHFATGFHHNSQLQQHQQQQPLQSHLMSTKASPYSDANVRSSSEGIVSAAINALRQDENTVHQHQAHTKPPPRSRRRTIDTVPNSTSRLDAMTDLFLEQSRARLSSRRLAIMGPRNNTSSAPPRQQQVVPTRSMQQQKPFLLGGAEATMNGAMSRQSLVAFLGAEVEAQTKACLASRSQQRKVSMLGSLGLGM
eukprot:CAMPEP_0201909998 /NCGR_PEP_ID=MMETSP0903-20130614/1536_1 /ASSEMBLY_ACC=CAM_ASM_000552 /TAXON_ID=420261 /ORGANISM="Thalassiosira antarctica, Strain CCMP982" /LENGTH=640 /DNA_ID=CAMNT_0048444581 /DNA_START=36 /DNA_END=1958 /DNA_ORIENTATION=-